MSDDLFPSGPWTGFYNFRPGDRHRMDMQLTFGNGLMAGEGNDDVGRFLIKGRYDTVTRECHWTKTYLGAHDVFYRGFREGKGIWGTWEINIFGHGGFHIWPRGASDMMERSEVEKRSEPVDAITIPAGAPAQYKTLSPATKTLEQLTVVKAAGDKPEILHLASFGERIFATPALVGGRLYLRTQSKLYAFGE